MIKHFTLLSVALVLSILLPAQTPLKVIPTNKNNISKILFDHSGNNVYYNSNTTIFRVNMGVKNLTYYYTNKWNVRDFSISYDDKYIYSTDGKIQIWAIDGKQVASNLFQLNNIKKIEVSPNNQYFTYCTKDKLSNIFFPKYSIRNISVQSKKIRNITYNASGSLLAVGYEKNVADIWNISENKLISTYQGEFNEITTLSFSTDDKHLFVGMIDGTLIMWDIVAQKIKFEFPGNGQPIIGIFQINSYVILSATKEGLIDTWEYYTGKRIKKLKTEDKIIKCLDFSKKKNLIVFVRANGDLVFYDLHDMLRLPGTRYYAILDTINRYVRKNLISWQKRGKYEKTEDFLYRVDKKNRDRKIEEFTNQATNKCGLELLRSDNTLLAYDPDSEQFKISPEDLDPLYVQVPIDEAPDFEKNYNKLVFQDVKFALSDNRLTIQTLTIINPEDDKTYKYSNLTSSTFNVADFSMNFEDVKVEIPESEAKVTPSIVHKSIVVGISDVDKDIPEKSIMKKTKAYVLVIGNEDYTTYQTNLGSEVTVDYAVNDAEIVSKYLEKTFGVPEKNITLLRNATYAQMMRAINKLEIISEISDGECELIFYYSGHGLPDEETKEAFIMPVDASATTLESAIKLNDILSKLTTYPSVKVLAIIDACFSGGGRNQGLLAMKSVKIKPSDPSLKGNLVVLSSSTGEESSGVYREKQHGMFTYYFLKKLQDSQGDITLKELADYIQEKVELESVIINNKRQTPQVLYSPDVEGIWETWRLVE